MKVKTYLMTTLLFVGLNPKTRAMDFPGFILPARYYDAAQGRFISADSVVPNANDPQSLNRYAYVRNNPLNLTDPSGHSWLSNIVNKAGNWIGQHREFSGLVFQTFDPFFGSAYLASFGNGRDILAGEVIAAGSFGFGGPQVGWGAVSGELSSAYVARKTGSNMMNAVVRGGLEGAAISEIFSQISATNSPWEEKAVEKSAISAIVTAAEGGNPKSIERSAGLTFASEAANSYFTSTVGYAPNPSPGLAQPDGSYYYDASVCSQPPPGTNVWGVDEGPNGNIWHDTWIQGGPVSTVANLIPGQNALAELHDTWLNTGFMGSMPPVVQNFASMPLAFATSYAAEFAGPWAPVIPLSQR